jgi:two-component system chemotaxis sensor kinase CheA
VDPTFCSILVQHLIHLTRNSVDHGLEFPSERLTLGKKENGCISISVSKTNEQHVVISIKDDGRGINVERLIEKAQEAGIDMSRFNEENAWELIFEPGLSTASEESLTSGRGIGMFDVQKFIRDSRGEIKVSTQKGVGTEFIITLPTF